MWHMGYKRSFWTVPL